MKVKVMLYEYTPTKEGTYPIKIKTTYTENGKTIERFHPINAYATKAQWDQENKRVKPSHPNSQAINLKIATMMFDLENQLIKTNDVSFKKSSGTNVIAYYESLLKDMKVKHSAAYYNMQHSVKEKLKAWNQNLTFDKVKPSDIRNYESHLIGLGNSRVTIQNNFKRLKTVFKEAVKDGLLEYAKNPFLGYVNKGMVTKKQRISYDQIKAIEQLDLKEGTGIWHTRNYWLFSFYCAGIRFGDLCRLKKSNIITVKGQKRLVYTMNKTTKNRNILLIPQATDILNKYKKAHKEFLFGIVDHIPKDKFKELQAIASQNTVANKNLKSLAVKIESPVKLSFHSSRHSFADYAIKMGLDVHTIKDLLGHDKISTTEIYLQSFYIEETDQAIKTMFG